MPPTGVKLWQNEFRTIPDILFQAFVAHWDAIIRMTLAIGMKSSQWMEVGWPIGMRLWINQLE